MNPGFVLQSFIKEMRSKKDKPSLDLFLNESLHPSLSSQANELEYCVKRFEYGIQNMLTQYGK